MAADAATIDKQGEQGDFGADNRLDTDSGGGPDFIGGDQITAEDPFPHRFKNLVFVWGGDLLDDSPRAIIERQRTLARGLTATALGGYSPPLRAFHVSASGGNQLDPDIRVVRTSSN